MHKLRSIKLLPRLWLVWFVLSVGIAVASPIFKPQSMDLVCSGAGVMKLVQTGDDADGKSTVQKLDCPLCTTPSAPPCELAFKAEPPSPLAYALKSIPSATIAGWTLSPLPPRGPPAFS